jgi:hypothetical protein
MNSTKAILIFTIVTTMAIVNFLLFGLSTDLLREPSDMSVAMGVLVFPSTILFDFLIFKLTTKLIK